MKSKRNINTVKLTAVIGFFVVLYGCHNNIKSKIEFSQDDIDFSMYKQFSWPDYEPLIKQSPHIHPIITNGIKKSVSQTLEAKGYQFVLNSTSADFIVSYALSSSNEEAFEPAAKLEIDYGECIHPLSDSSHLTAYPSKNDVHSVLILSIFDVNRCAVVWQARTNTQFNPHSEKTNQNSEIHATVKELLKQFPVK